MPNHPLAEVFGFPPDNFSGDATRYRRNKLCPFNNGVPNCTKDRANEPLGVCSIIHKGKLAITCPIRFRQEWLIVDDAATFFFPPGSTWTSLTEVRLNDKEGKVAGDIDIVLVQYDGDGKVVDFGALEVQAVYISGNMRRPFEYYMGDPTARADMDWRKEKHYPRPDYLSSSRKRLAPQLLYKGGILKDWDKKVGVVLDRGFFETLPNLQKSEPAKADMAWFVYDMEAVPDQNRYRIVPYQTIYTTFSKALEQMTRSEAGNMDEFIKSLQAKLDKHLTFTNPPDTQQIELDLG